ncbi:adenylate/guanylate cyclase domain-containing protein [Erythrobacter sp. Alg231-14]|uniref:adenylate/guanylate cyclase domain-containing protein n=1 Tax=Erythrobacter sp. Alg231-14 TaxID=1922225 RepID=UPI000D55BB16
MLEKLGLSRANGEGSAQSDLAVSRPQGEGGTKRLLYSLATLILLLALCAPFMTDSTEQTPPELTDGTIDFSAYGELTKPVKLEGEWRFDWDDTNETTATRAVETVLLPGLWTASDPALPRTGRATYSLEITGLTPGSYTLFVPLVYSATEVSINDELVSGRGIVGSTREDTEYQVRSQTIHFDTEVDRVTIDIDVAAFHHKDNGLEAAPVIGERAIMGEWSALRWSRETLYHGTLLLILCLNISVFVIRRSDKAALLLSISAVAFMTPAGVAGFDNLLLLVAPNVTFQQMSFLISISLTIAPLTFFAYAQALYPDETPRWVARVVYVALPFFGVIHATMIAFNYTLEASLLQRYMAFGNVATLAAVALIGCRGWINRRTGAGLFFISLAGFVAIFAMNALIHTGLFRETEIPAYSLAALNPLLMLFSQVIIMAERWGTAITDMEDRNLELKRLLDINTSISTEIKLEPLLRKIVGVTSQIIAADRSSLFLYNPLNDELLTSVAEGMGERQIRLDPDKGIAGACLRAKEAIFVEDAYADDRFDRSVDDNTGYRTQSILAVPILSKDGKALGVMQALNRSGGQPFLQDDLLRMNAFASQAAIAIENANLFEEVVSERNYNDSILGSLGNGVITIGRDGKIVKSNAAAEKILSRDKDEFEAAEIGLILRLQNETLNEDFVRSLSQGEQSNLTDVDLDIDGGVSGKSVNLSVSPLLRGANAAPETLIVLEDISESKRLNGTLRRFMPQEIVDEVLGKDTELLFGNALDASVLFADIRGFTSLSEQLSARGTVDMLNEAFGDMCEAISSTDGVVDKFIGDAIMAVYGVPLSRDNNSELAVSGGLAIFGALRRLNSIRDKRGQGALGLGVGISTGEVVAGTIGSQKRMDYTVIGDTVNLASRLEALTKTYGVQMIVCDQTAANLGSDFRVRNLDLIKVRGRQASTTLYEVIDQDRPDIGPGYDDMLAAYQNGRQFYHEGDFKRAAAAFVGALEADPTDEPAKIMLDRTKSLMRRKLDGDWDGVWQG